MLLVEVLQHLVVCVARARVHLAGQGLGEDLDLLGSQVTALWHRHLELDDKVASQLLVFEERHPESPYDLLAVVPHDLACSRVNGVLLAVEMGELKAEADQRLSQTDCLFVEEVCSLAREVSVRNFLDDQQQVSGRCLGLCKEMSTTSFP